MADRQTIADVEASLAQFITEDVVLLDRAVPVLKREIAAILASHRKMREENERFRTALGTIAEGTVPPPKHGHYLAHRAAVKLARQALQGDADVQR